MKIVRKKGWPFQFNPDACKQCGGKCCIGEPGDIWVSSPRISKIANHLGLEIWEFSNRFLRRGPKGYSLKEVQLAANNFACIFFDTTKKQCSIYAVRPLQCRSFPFWKIFQEYPKEADQECPGVRLDKGA